MPTVKKFLPCTNKKVQKATSRNILLSWLIENRPRPVLLAKFLGLFDSSFPPNPKVSGVRFFGCRGWVRKKRRRRGGDAHYSSIPSVASALLRRDAAGDCCCCCCSNNGTEERGGRSPSTHPKKGGRGPTPRFSFHTQLLGPPPITI